jgi:hypothetical protein
VLRIGVCPSSADRRHPCNATAFFSPFGGLIESNNKK